MNQKERWFLSGVLGLVLVLVGTDIFGDSKDGVDLWHLMIEGAMGFLSLIGIFYLLRDAYRSKKELTDTKERFSAYREEAEKWRAESRKYVEGLSLEIDRQLLKWNLTEAEKEVAFLLLKGLSLKEVASARNTTEKTARVQSMSIYAKAGLSSRSELSAFFLEDLLVPQKKNIRL